MLEVGLDDCFSSCVGYEDWYGVIFQRHLHMNTQVFPFGLGWKGPLKSRAMEYKSFWGSFMWV